VEAKSTLNIDLESLKEKFRNTEEYVKRVSKEFKVDEYEWVLSIPKHLGVPEIKGVKVIRNPEVPYEDE
ncbi:MAG: hypothetical protein GXO39_07845, partial [Thermotogae bacterium]|nr:hypothetical protein [Thermotogota bacterium]